MSGFYYVAFGQGRDPFAACFRSLAEAEAFEKLAQVMIKEEHAEEVRGFVVYAENREGAIVAAKRIAAGHDLN